MTKSTGVTLCVLLAAGAAILAIDALPALDPARATTRMPDAIRRVSATEAVPVPIGRVRDFALLGRTLYLLDAVSHRVVALERAADGSWRGVAEFGRRGEGPGELDAPAGIAAVGGRIVVAELSGELEHFSAEGRHLESGRLDLPCLPASLKLLPSAPAGLYLAGNCVGHPGMSHDSVDAILFWSPDGKRAEVLARRPRFTTDGRWGLVYSATEVLNVRNDSVYFGTGIPGCVLVGAMRGGRFAGTEWCGLASVSYSSPPPVSAEETLREMAGRGRAWQWPDELPAYVGALPTSHGLVLLRPFSGDSLVFQLASRAAWEQPRRMAVADMDGFVGCKPEGCLWFEAGEEGSAIGLVTTASLEGP